MIGSLPDFGVTAAAMLAGTGVASARVADKKPNIASSARASD
jgi:hypothetical protein